MEMSDRKKAIPSILVLKLDLSVAVHNENLQVYGCRAFEERFWPQQNRRRSTYMDMIAIPPVEIMGQIELLRINERPQIVENLV
jgi:hypothetical protein